MPYIGKSPVGGGFHKLDNLTASATATYALTLGSAAYYPETANQLLVSLNGVIQAPQDSFTVSGSNLVFDSALTSNDSIDFVVALGDVLGVGSVTDGAITTAKIGNNAVTDAKLAAGAVTSAKLPTGSVLQVVNSQLASTTQLTSSGAISELSTSLRLSITPTAANSILYFDFYAPFVSPNSNNLAYAYFYDVTNSAAVNLAAASGSRTAATWTKRTTAFDPNDMDTMHMKTADTSGSTTARTYTIYHGTEGAVHQFLQSTLSTSAGASTKPIFTITEVAG